MVVCCQDPNKLAYLRNDKNEFLNYTDDWYVLGFKPDKYAVIYYKGNNDAWKGYGGVTVYTRDRRMNNAYIEDISKAMDKVGAVGVARPLAACHGCVSYPASCSQSTVRCFWPLWTAFLGPACQLV